MNRPGKQRLVVGLADGLASCAKRSGCPTMIAPIPRDNFGSILIGKPLPCVLTGNLQSCLDSLGATVEKDDMVEVSGKDLDEPRGEFERGGCGSDEGGIGKLAKLPGGGINQPFFAVAHIDAPESRHRVKVFVPVRVDHSAAMALDENQWGLSRCVLSEWAPKRVRRLLDGFSVCPFLRLHPPVLSNAHLSFTCGSG